MIFLNEFSAEKEINWNEKIFKVKIPPSGSKTYYIPCNPSGYGFFEIPLKENESEE